MKQTLLRCPICHKQMYSSKVFFSCGKHHFDSAKEGYVNLCIPPIKGDDSHLVKAREDFFLHNPYEPLMSSILPWVAPLDVVLDMGCGIGSYLRYLKDKLPSLTTIGFDGSKIAIKKASRSDLLSQYIVANINSCPIIDHCIDVVLSIFAPFQISEVKRVLKPGGRFVCVEPGINHLVNLKTVLYPSLRLNEVSQPLIDSFSLIHEECVEFNISCDHSLLMSLFHMTPYAYTTSKEAQEKLSAIVQLDVLASFVLRVYEIH
jgi:23S rRNA (guanine745-N1)-methyltransferase